MASLNDAKADLMDLAERLRTVAESLKRLPTDHPNFSEQMEALREEVKVIAAELRGD